MEPTESTVTFVTAYMNIYPNNRLGSRDMIWRFEQFAKIAQTGIQLCVYVDESSVDLLDQFIAKYPNIKRMHVYKNIYHTWVYDKWRPYRNMHIGNIHKGLPHHRNVQKDTFEYMALMHTKMECMADAMKTNPWGSSYFAWIDFNVAHVFKDLDASQRRLKAIAANRWSRPFLAIPGCWDALPVPITAGAISELSNQIHWRFCGGFFLGDIRSMREFCDLYSTHLPKFFAEFNRMVWEVNFWAWMENRVDSWKPYWYAGDHNDSILNIPKELWAICLSKDACSYTCSVHDCPEIDVGMYASSASIVPVAGAGSFGSEGYWMNTRYVNYRLADNGGYIFNDPEDHTIVTRNVCTRLDAEMMPQEHFEMGNPTNLASRPCNFDGVEDIRLWLDEDGRIRFIGSSVNYSASLKVRMVEGVYDTQAQMLTEARVIEPPTETACEKNWCPLPGRRFVYRWSDMSIGHLERDEGTYGTTGKLLIDSSCDAVPWGFSDYRGSTYFRPSLESPGDWLGLVHFSVNEWPRQYYHVMVLLDGTTLRPKRRSQPFSFFQRTNIEFCIGMVETVLEDGTGWYHFWVSNYDREPMHVKVSIVDIPLHDV